MSESEFLSQQIRELASKEAKLWQALVHENAIYEGTLERVDEEAIGGWIWDANRPMTPLEISIFDNGKLLVSLSADMYREDLETEGKGDGRHGFLIATPDELKTGGKHILDVRVAGTDAGPTGSPWKVRF